MSTSRRRSVSERLALAATALLGVALAGPAHADPSPATFSGVDVAHFAIPDLHVNTRDDRTPEHGGITLSYADDHGQVRAVVRLAVARDAAGARAFVTAVMRGVSGELAPSAIDDVAFADEGGRGAHFVVAAHGNVAYAIDTASGATSASTIAALLRKTIAPGTPTFPSAKIALPAVLDRADARGAPVTLSVPSGATYRVHASGAYVTRGRMGELIHPFASGSVEVTAIVVDSLARVTEVRASAVAR